MSRLVLLQSVVFCFVLHTAERDSSAGERGHRAGQSAGSKRETHTHTHPCISVHRAPSTFWHYNNSVGPFLLG